MINSSPLLYLVLLALQSIFICCAGSLSLLAYNKTVISCLKKLSNINLDALSQPIDAVMIEDHYKDLLKKTESLRNIAIHSAAGYNGPWIENMFIDRFIRKPLSFFNGFIPLFVQFVDIHVQSILTETDNYTSTLQYLASILRDDVIYLAISQDDQGIGILQGLKPNILTLSAGGYGHIPIPLIKGDLPYVLPPEHLIGMGFTGQLRPRLSRYLMLKEMSSLCSKLNIGCRRFGPSLYWRQEMNITAINLAPRGFGRTSYKLVEVIQMGRIPAYLYDDIPWIPYEHSNISITNFGFLGKFHQFSAMATNILNLLKHPSKLKEKLEQIRLSRYYYTYKGVLEQIELFLRDPLGPDGGYLQCPTTLPQHDHR